MAAVPHPGTLTVTGSYLAGFFIVWEARRAIKMTSIVTGLAVAAVGVLACLGWDASAIRSWLNSTTAWAGESIEGPGNISCRFFRLLAQRGSAVSWALEGNKVKIQSIDIPSLKGIFA